MDAKERAEQLVNALLPYAEQMLGEHGEFLPYAGVTTPEGEIQLMQFATENEEQQTLTAPQIHRGAIEVLREGAQDGKYATTALVANVTVQGSEKADRISAVSVSLDDAEGNSLDVFFPYTIKDGEVEFDTAFAQRGAHAVFGPEPDGDIELEEEDEDEANGTDR